MRTISLARLHRAGYSLALPLARLARLLAPRAAGAGEPAGAVLAALLGARPWYPGELDQPPRPGIRPFESRADLRRAADALARLTLRVAIAADVLGAEPAAAAGPEAPDLDQPVRTALTRVLAGGALSAAPLGRAEVAAARARLADPAAGAGADADARAAVEAALTARGITGGREFLPALVDSWLQDIADALDRLPPDSRGAGLRTDGKP